MKWQPGIPLKIIVALVNLSFIAIALALPQHGVLLYLAVAVWTVHGLMAVASVFIAPMKGVSRGWAVQTLFVGTLSLIHLLRLEQTKPQA